MVGRPKLSDLSCTICDKTFKRKSLLEEHMKDHSPIPVQSRQARICSNWCHTCRKGFDDDEYKTHIQTEHVLDLPKVDFKRLNDDLFSLESGYVVLSKKRIKREDEPVRQEESLGENENNHFNIFVPEIKLEPCEELISEMNRSGDNAVPTKPRTSLSMGKRAKIKMQLPKMKCEICGMRFKGHRGLKIHMSAHRRSRKIPEDISHAEDNVDEEKQPRKGKKRKKINSSLDCSESSIALSNNSILNLGQNQPAGVVLNVSQLQNQSSNTSLNLGYNNNMLSFINQPNSIHNVTNEPNNILNTGNSSDVQVVPDSNAQKLETIPKFECSEKYMKWLKRFITKCKDHKYPLDHSLCINVGLVADEITIALANPDGLLRKKSNHFYFMRMLKSLSEIILGHMRHSLCVVKR